MPNTIEQVNALMRSPAYANRWQGGPWHNRCEQFVNNLGGFGQSFSTALLAAKASGPLNADLTHIRDGAVGYWSGVWLWDKTLQRFIECGHTAFWRRGRWAMASDAVTEKVGNGTGTITHAEYERLRPAAKWLGWSMRHGTETLATISAAPVALAQHIVIPTLTKPRHAGEDEMAEPIYAKGDKDSNVYALYLNAGDANSTTGFAGAVYSGRRWVSAGEFRIVEALGFPHPKQSKLIVIQQAAFDQINKLAGSL